MLRTALGFLICTLGCVAAHPGCFTDDREPDSGKTALSFCPETQWGGGETIEFGSCCTDLEEEEAEIQFLAAGTVNAGCEPLYKEFVCGQCHSFSGHLFERLGAELGPWDGLTLTEEFCEELVNQCSPDITFPVYDGGSLSFCEKHVGDVDQYYAYPFEEGELFTGGLVEAFPDIPLYERPGYLMHMQQSPDGSMYWFAGREGQISKVLASDTGTIELVVNIGGSYEDAGIDKYLLFSIEEGLQGFCFDPNFADNGFFYTTYTVQGTEVAYQRTSRFTYVEGDPTATRASQQLLYDAGPRVVFIHNGGWLGFKPSDYGKGNDWNDLYVAIGDGADFHDPSGTTQDLTNLMGSIIRLSVPSAPESSGYSIPEGNYEDLTGVAALPELCAVGLRNPFRCGFDRDTDELYCGDVGQDKVETIKNIKCGSNYGWGIFEGSRCQSEVENNGVYPSCSSADRSLYTFPIFEYCHIGYYADSEEEQVYTNTEDLCGNRLIEGNSAIGGPVYRGTSFSDILGGALLFADYTMQTVNYLKQDCDGIWQPGRLEFGGAVQVYSFFEDVNGEVMFLTSTGEIFHLPCGDLCSGDPNPALHPSVSECNAPSPVTPDSAAPPTTAPQGEEFPVAGGYVELGCAADPKPGQDGGRLMSEGPILDEGSMSAEICFGICQDNLPGFEYFGTQWSIECFCATTLPDDLSFDPEYEGCDFTCAGSPDGEICGGYEAITVYTVADME